VEGNSYWVCVITKNGANSIRETLDSILNQTTKPKLIVVVDDGSVDATPRFIESYSNSTSLPLKLIQLPDRGYDIRRVSANINEAYAYVEKRGISCEYSMISGDDCVFPADYSEFLLSRLGLDKQLVIASGDWGVPPPPSRIKPPQGAGRFIREDFWRRLGGRYPDAYGWETWVLFKAMELGFRIANFSELRYVHLRPSGSIHKFGHWGIAMRALGYHPLLVLLPLAKNMLRQYESISIQGNLSMIANYFLPQRYAKDPYFRYFDHDLRAFVRRQQLERLLATPQVQRMQATFAALWKCSEILYRL
jgi:glycosyltransferase involved in cell wall biosynthesis